MISPTSRLKCSQGHVWDAGASSAAPLVCPTCGRPPTGGPVAADPEQTVDHEIAAPVAPAAGAADPDMTVDHQVDVDRTVDLPSSAGGERRGRAGAMATGKGMDRNEVTESMHFTPLPRAPGTGPGAAAAAGHSTAGITGAGARGGGGGGGLLAHFGAMPFTILRQHARGGLGLVNLARDEHIKREVALKQILPQHADNSTLKKRFLYEAQITGQLEHPSIVPVYTLGEDAAANPYYVMRFVKGRTLDEIIKEHHTAPNPIVFRELLRRFIAVCQAVAYAHSRGVIHRDLKPSNIMLGDYGETLVLDWGLAKDIKNKQDPALFIDESGGGKSSSGKLMAPGGAEMSTAGKGNSVVPTAELTMQGQIIGTPAYMAPEQAEGRTDLHGPVTDIYALGGILYKIRAGQSPTAPTASTSGGMRKLTFVASAPPSKINKEVHPSLEVMCMRAMATEPAMRYPRALELAQDIQRWLDEHPLSLKRETAMVKVMGVLRKYAWLIVIGLLVVIAALLVMVVMGK